MVRLSNWRASRNRGPARRWPSGRHRSTIRNRCESATARSHRSPESLGTQALQFARRRGGRAMPPRVGGSGAWTVRVRTKGLDWSRAKSIGRDSGVSKTLNNSI
jgi:hypothetical protein